MKRIDRTPAAIPLDSPTLDPPPELDPQPGLDPPSSGIPPRERPRERLHRLGCGALSDQELLAVVLATGSRGCSALEIGASVLGRWGGLEGLVGRSPAELRERGLGPGKAAALCAAVELGARLARPTIREPVTLRRPEAVARYLDLRYRLPNQEVMGALFLNSRGRLLEEREIFRGGLARATVEPAPVLKSAILRDASGIILFHTHPSGDPAPSLEDVEFTRRMREAATVLGIELIDHLILGHSGRWVSLRARGAF